MFPSTGTFEQRFMFMFLKMFKRQHLFTYIHTSVTNLHECYEIIYSNLKPPHFLGPLDRDETICPHEVPQVSLRSLSHAQVRGNPANNLVLAVSRANCSSGNICGVLNEGLQFGQNNSARL